MEVLLLQCGEVAINMADMKMLRVLQNTDEVLNPCEKGSY